MMKRYKFGDCLSLIRNGASISQKDGSNGIPITRIETLSHGRFNRDKMGYADIYDVSAYKDFILVENDLLMSHINSRTYLGRCVQYHKKDDEVIIHGMNLLRLQTKGSILDSTFAYYLCKTPYFKKCIDGIRIDAVNQSSFNMTDLCQIYVYLPDIAEQKKIAHILTLFDKEIELKQSINKDLESLARQLYDYWFVQFDFPDINGKPYKSSGGEMVYNEKLKLEIPQGWEVKPISELLGKVPTTYKLSTKEYKDIGKYPVIDQTTGEYIVGFTDREDAVVHLHPVVVFGDHSCAVKYVNFDFCRGADGTQILNSNDERVSTEYLYFATKDVRFQSGYARHFSILKDSLIIVPDKETAKQYRIQARKLFDLIGANISEISSLTRQRDELLPLLMNGQITIE